MRFLATAALAAVTAGSTLTMTPTHAEARHWGHHRGWVGLGIAGAVLGGLALSRHRYYYDDPYYYGYDYPYYGRSYYRSYGYYGGRHHRRGWGGPAWGARGHGWAGRHRHH